MNANAAGVRTASNDAILQAAEAYFDLQLAGGHLAISREAATNAAVLADITGSYARTGAGLEADHRRALAELKRRRREIKLAEGQLLVASANLVRLLVLDPKIVIAPIEPAETIVRLIPDDAVLDELVIQGLRQRPELAGAQQLVEASIYRLKQARLGRSYRAWRSVMRGVDSAEARARSSVTSGHAATPPSVSSGTFKISVVATSP